MKTRSTIVMLSVVGMVVALAGSTQAELIAHYAFDEASGTIATDSSGSATNHGGILIGTNLTGTGMLTLNGIDQHVRLEGGAAEQPTTSLQLPAFTIATLFKRTGDGVGVLGESAIPLITKGVNAGDSPESVNINYFLGLNVAANTLQGHFEEGNGADHFLFGEKVIENDVWYHAAMTYDGATMKLYLDGSEDASTNLNVSAALSGLAASIGSAIKPDYAPLGFFEGQIDDVRIYDSALSQPEIATIVYGAPGTLIYGM